MKMIQAIFRRQPGMELVFRSLAFYFGMIWISGCGSPSYVHSSSLAMISGSTSPNHADYDEYREGRLSKSELMDRLPHVVLVGDSLSRNFFVSSLISSVWRSKLSHGHDWFLDYDPSTNSVYSLYERLEKVTPLVAAEYSSVGGEVDSGGRQGHFLGFLWPLNFSRQVDLILKNERFPDLLLLWIGHNNLNWAPELDPGQRGHAEDFLRKKADDFRVNYARQLGRLMDRAREQKQRKAIVVFGLVNFKSFFEARDSAEKLRGNNPKLYPYFDVDYQRFESMKPEYRGNMVKLALMMNRELHDLVDEINQQQESGSRLRLEYSDALANVDISAAELIHRMDAWHPSSKGHSMLADAAFGALGPSLKFLGISPERKFEAVQGHSCLDLMK